MARRRRVNNEVEDDVAGLLTLFYHYISWRCEPESRNRLQQLLSVLESLADERNREKVRRLVKEVLKQFEEDAIFCQIPSRHR